MPTRGFTAPRGSAPAFVCLKPCTDRDESGFQIRECCLKPWSQAGSLQAFSGIAGAPAHFWSVIPLFLPSEGPCLALAQNWKTSIPVLSQLIILFYIRKSLLCRESHTALEKWPKAYSKREAIFWYFSDYVSMKIKHFTAIVFTRTKKAKIDTADSLLEKCIHIKLLKWLCFETLFLFFFWLIERNFLLS